MRLRINRTMRFTVGFTLCGALLSACASVGYTQAISSAPLAAARARHGNALPGLESLETIQSQAAPAPRVRRQAETISVHELLVPAAAIKEFQRSQKAVRSGNFQSAAEH